MSKIVWKLMGIILVALVVSGCSEKSLAIPKEKATFVEVLTVTSETYPLYVNYLGNVETVDTKNYSFKTAGKLASISVEKGQLVEKGTEIARIDTADLQSALTAALGQYESANAQYEKAVNGATKEEIEQAKLTVRQAEISIEQAAIVEEKAKSAVQFIEDQFKKNQELYKKGLLSKTQLDQLELEKKVKEQDYKNAAQQLEQAKVALAKAEEGGKQIRDGARTEDISALKGQVQQAKANVEAHEKLLSDTILYADTTGYIIDVPVHIGEVISAGYPIAIVRNPSIVVKTALTQKDLDQIQEGTEALVTYEGSSYRGTVSLIDAVPDVQTRTYMSEISLTDENELPLGTVVSVQFVIGEQQSIGIPISAIQNDGEKDYVFVINKEQRAAQKQINIIDSKEGIAMVEGLAEKDQVIIKGFKGLRSGTLVTTSESTESAITEGAGPNE